MRLASFSVGFVLALVLVCANSSAATSGEGRPHDATEFTNFVGTATRLPSGAIQLVKAGRTDAIGAAYTANRLSVGSGFNVRFTFSLSVPSTGHCLADGMTFIVQDEGPEAVGARGGYIGYARGFHHPGDGIRRSLALEFDVYANSSEDFGRHGESDPRVPHLSLQTRGVRQNDANPRYSLASASAPVLTDGEAHTVRVHYLRRHRLDVFLDGALLLQTRVSVARKLGLTDGRAFLGFTASTGACTEDADVDAVKIRGISIGRP